MRRIFALLLTLLSGLFPLAGSGRAQAQELDIVVENGRVYDGTGAPWIRADVGIASDRIIAVGDLKGRPARTRVDAQNMFVAPGFIDVHTHAGKGLATPELSHAKPLLTQGLTTVFINPDGGGDVDLAKQKEALRKNSLGVNVALMVPHGSIREAVMGTENRHARPDEIERMKVLVRAGMREGAFGMSSGLFYVPGSFADLSEVVELGKVVGEFGGAYSSHIRDESDYTIGLIASVDEVIRVAREAGIPGVVTHVKALGPRVWGFSEAVVQRIERARVQGVEVWADQYPYTASSTSLVAALVPGWAQAGGRAAMLKRFDNPEEMARIRREMVENLDRRGGAERIQIRSFEPDRRIEGKRLDDIGRERGQDAIEATLALLRQGSPQIVSFNMSDRDVEILMRQPWTITASDGDLVALGDGVPHPRTYGTFTRKLKLYAHDKGTVPMSQAIHSMTGLPATVFRVGDRGLLKPGMAADLVAFDLDRLQEKSTYTDPHHYSEGMVHVIVNGRFAMRDGRFAEDGFAGRVISRQDAGQ